MEFCPKCGSMIMGKKCMNCNHTLDKEIKIESSQKIEPKKEVVVINEGEIDFHPIVEAKCEKCNNKEAYFWTKQTRAGDEAETKFFKCTKCKHIWREYK